MVKSISTKYSGCNFRSRLEARYAVLFNYMGIRWEYEPEDFVLSNGVRYLPDFKIYYKTDFGEEYHTWLEVKAVMPNKTEIEKLHLLKELIVVAPKFLIGTPGFNFCYKTDNKKLVQIGKDEFQSIEKTLFFLDENMTVMQRMQLHDAIEEAKSARFEFGETP